MGNTFIQVHEEWIQLKKNKKLRMDEIALLCKIHSLTKNEKGACTASNAYFADLFCTTERNIQKYLQKLKGLGIITQYETRQGMKTTTRFLYVKTDVIDMLIKSMEADSCVDRADEQSGSSTRTNALQHTNNQVIPHEESNTLIKEENRKEENRKENVAAALSFDSLPKSSVLEKKAPTDAMQEMYSFVEKNYMRYFDGMKLTSTMKKRLDKMVTEVSYDIVFKTLKNNVSYMDGKLCNRSFSTELHKFHAICKIIEDRFNITILREKHEEATRRKMENIQINPDRRTAPYQRKTQPCPKHLLKLF